MAIDLRIEHIVAGKEPLPEYRGRYLWLILAFYVVVAVLLSWPF